MSAALLQLERAKFELATAQAHVNGAEAQLVRAQGEPPHHAAAFMQSALDALRSSVAAVRAAERQLESELYFPKAGPARLRKTG